MRTVSVVAVLAMSSTAIASVDPSAEPQVKSPVRATALSIGGTLVGLGGIYLGANMRDGGDAPIMMCGAMATLIGPSAGAWYANDSYTFTPGLGIRLAGAAVMAFGYFNAVDRACDGYNNCTGPVRSRESDATIGVGAAIAVAGVIYDVASAGGYAREHNAKLRAMPVVTPTPSGGTVGVALSF